MSLICELKLICGLDLEYIMCPTDPNIYKAICGQEEWHGSHCTLPARGSTTYAIQPSNVKGGPTRPRTPLLVRHGNGITMQECSLRLFKTINYNHIMLFICYEYVYEL